MQSNSAVRSLVALGASIAASLFAVSLFAATASAQQYKIAQIVYDNPGPFTQEQLAAVSGVKPGDPATAATLQDGAQKLSDSGFFDDVGAEFRGNTLHLVAVFQLKPTPRSQMIPVGFQNFVWLTPAEIDSAIHASVPLYFGYLQENTVQVDQVRAALERALGAKGVHASVEHSSVEPTLAHPFRSMVFVVVNPLPIVANVKLDGVTPELAPLVQASVNAAAHKPWNNGITGLRTEELMLGPLLDAGYIHAHLGNLVAEPGTPEQRSEPVAVEATLVAGEIYHVTAIDFAGAPLLSPEAFASGVKLHPGDIASRKLLFETLVPLDEAYRKQGYMDVIVKADPKEDAAAHTVAYTVTVVPGEQYRLAKITTDGLDPAAQAEFQTNFRLKTGDLYDPTYVASFIRNNTALKALAPYYGGFKAIADPNKHTVALELKFYTGPTINVR